MPDGRWLDRDALARHISVRVDAIARLQRAGRLPNPSYHLGQRQPRWDRDAESYIAEIGRTIPRTAARTQNGQRNRRFLHGLVRHVRAPLEW